MARAEESTVGHVLFDADGVLQHAPADWRERLAVRLGEDWEDVAYEIWQAEKPSLRGEGDFLVAIEEIVERHRSPTTADDLHAALWRTIDQVPTTIDLVRRLRAAGYGVHLGTNQHAQRAAIMRDDLGYDELFDVSVYSCEIEVKKPDPRYFARAAAALVGVDPAEVVFLDDREDNVESARSVGMAAERWDHRLGLPALEALLARHGVHPVTVGELG